MSNKQSTRHSTMRLIRSIIFYVIVGLLSLYILMEIFVPSLTIKVFQFQTYVVVTESMEPLINVNDLVVDTNPNLDKLNEGDIITFYADIDYNGTKEVVTHYIYSIGTDSLGNRIFRTVRNGGTVPDTWVLHDEDILGVYWFKIPQMGMLINFVKSPFGIATIAVNVIIIGTIVYIVKSGSTKSKKQNEEHEQSQ